MPFDCPAEYADVSQVARAIVVWKSQFTLALYEHGKRVSRDGEAACYEVAMGAHPAGDKEAEGDEKTPEGTFRITHKNPKSAFHLSLGISYPDTVHADRMLASEFISQQTRDRIARADRARGMPPDNTPLGGDIYIHGGGSSPNNWTNGCVALSDDHIETVYAWAEPGTTVVILP